MAMFSIQNKVTANIQRAQTVSRTSRWRPLADTTQSWCQTPPKTARNKLHDRGIDLGFQQKSPAASLVLGQNQRRDRVVQVPLDAKPSRLLSGEFHTIITTTDREG